MKGRYKVHKFYIRMTKDQHKLEEFLNGLKGEIVAIIPNATGAYATGVDFLFIVERVS